MLNLRQRLIIAISLTVGLIAALILVYFVFLRQPKLEQGAAPSSAGGAQQVQPTAPATVAPPTFMQSDESEPERMARQIARIFVERFGSYSNQNDNQHIEAVLSMATPSMVKWIETQRLSYNSSYYGVTTQVIASRIESITADSADVRVDVQQVIEDGQGSRTEQRSGRVELAGSGVDWKVDGLYWD